MAGRLIDGETNDVRAAIVKVDAAFFSQCANFCSRLGRYANSKGVEKIVVNDIYVHGDKIVFQHPGIRMDLVCDRRQSLGAMVHSVHAGHNCRQGLGGANVGCGFFAADVLFAGLQRHAIGGAALSIPGDADDASGRLPFIVVACSKIGGVRPAVAEGHAKALCRADGCIGAEFAGRREQGQAHQVGGDGDFAIGAMRFFDKIGILVHQAVLRRKLQQRAEQCFVEDKSTMIADDDSDAQGGGARHQHVYGCLHNRVGDEKCVGAVFNFFS